MYCTLIKDVKIQIKVGLSVEDIEFKRWIACGESAKHCRDQAKQSFQVSFFLAKFKGLCFDSLRWRWLLAIYVAAFIYKSSNLEDVVDSISGVEEPH